MIAISQTELRCMLTLMQLFVFYHFTVLKDILYALMYCNYTAEQKSHTLDFMKTKNVRLIIMKKLEKSNQGVSLFVRNPGLRISFQRVDGGD